LFEIGTGAVERLNAVILSEVWWFVIPAILLGIQAYDTYDCKTPLQPGSLQGVPAASISIACGLALGAFALWLTGWQNISHGLAGLPGDSLSATVGFRAAASATTALLAAVTEECVIRGRLQFRLQTAIGRRGAEVVADFVFVLIHFALFDNAIAIFHIGVLGVVNGRIAALSQRLAWPVTIHALANGTAIAVTLIARVA
jgi:membrane protease YdiL (CAAX protease family)